MQDRADRIFVGVVSAFVLLGFTAIAFSSLEGDRFPLPQPPKPKPTATVGAEASPASWFAEMRPFCNPVDVATRLEWSPAPDVPEGTMYEAACYALAGDVEEARAALATLSTEDQWRGAGVVFEAGHPAADAGDELAAGPLMELVVEFWPNHYMALYHAGAAAHQRGEADAARAYLERFLEHYALDDAWREAALGILADIG